MKKNGIKKFMSWNLQKRRVFMVIDDQDSWNDMWSFVQKDIPPPIFLKSIKCIRSILIRKMTVKCFNLSSSSTIPPFISYFFLKR